MLINFSISNFGSVKDKQVLSFEASKSTFLEDYYVINVTGIRLLKLALIYGANASGKTTILNALNFLRDLITKPAEKKSDELVFDSFLFDAQKDVRNSSLSIEFLQNKVRYYYEVEFNKTSIINEELNFYKPNKASVFKRTTNLKKQFTEITFGSKIKIEKPFEKTLAANTLWNNTVLAGFTKTNIELTELKDAVDWFSNYLKPIILPDTELGNLTSLRIDKTEINSGDVIQILKKADFDVSNLVIKDHPRTPDFSFIFDSKYVVPETKEKFKSLLKMVEFEHTIGDRKYYLPFKLESNGTQRYYGFAGILSLLIRNSMAIPIDELEASLHPDLYRHFLLTFLVNAKQSQLIATTHNREILDQREIFRNDAIWFTEKNDQGATELYSLDDFDSKVIRDSSNIYKAYKTGKLGGVPDLGDYYIDLTNEEK